MSKNSHKAKTEFIAVLRESIPKFDQYCVTHGTPSIKIVNQLINGVFDYEPETKNRKTVESNAYLYLYPEDKYETLDDYFHNIKSELLKQLKERNIDIALVLEFSPTYDDYSMAMDIKYTKPESDDDYKQRLVEENKKELLFNLMHEIGDVYVAHNKKEILEKIEEQKLKNESVLNALKKEQDSIQKRIDELSKKV